MKTLYIDCSMGAAGDMLAAALLELMPDADAALSQMNAFGIHGVAYARERMAKCGIMGTHLSVKVHGEEEGRDDREGSGCRDHRDHRDHRDDREMHEHGHGHHEHHHEHHGLGDVLHLVGHLALPEKVKGDVAAVYQLLADAESRAHGRPVGEVHFHEVGALDAVADIAAVCWLLAELAPDEVVVSPIHVGSGTVRCAHGILPVPAPATAFLLEGVPSYSDGAVQGELCTPTGAALLKHFATRFGPQPTMSVKAVGYGAGAREFEGRANLLRASLGESVADGDADEVFELTCNIDDMTGEEIAFACERLFAAGAKDVLTIPVTMKKGRPGVMIQALCAVADHDALVAAMFRHTTTLGIRETRCRRQVLARREETVALSDGTTVRRKVSEGYGVRRATREFDDVAAAARAADLPIRDVVGDF